VSLILPDEGYSRNMVCPLNLLSTFLFGPFISCKQLELYKLRILHNIKNITNIIKISCKINAPYKNRKKKLVGTLDHLVSGFADIFDF